MTAGERVIFGPPPSNWCWADMDPETSADVLGRLATWVTWFRAQRLCWRTDGRVPLIPGVQRRLRPMGCDHERRYVASP